MIKERKKKIELLSEFTQICKKEKIWYSMDEESLLGVVCRGGFVPWMRKIQVMMTVKSYMKLKKLFLNRVTDSSIDKRLKNNLKGYFIDNKKDIINPQAFIEIRILVPTSHKKIKKFRKVDLLERFKHGRMNTKRAINILDDQKFEGYIALEFKRQKFDHSWIQVFSQEVKTMEFEGVKVDVIKEYKVVLTDWFGENYNNIKNPKRFYNYISPIITTKEEV
ncbi:MAG: LicD family protein [Mycoplasmataceae bacterium]|nr:LicD family protein [Mycoplasmataceae bacterium]